MKPALPTLAALTFICASAYSQTPPIDAAKIRGEVEALLEIRAQARVTSRNTAIQEITKRAQTPNAAVGFYEDAYKDITFAGKPSGGQDKVDWAKKNADALQSQELKAAAQLNLKYLALTIQRSGSDKALDFVAPSVDYVREFANDEARVFARQEKVSDDQRKLLATPIKDSVIVKANSLQALIKDLPDWEQVPGNLDGIFEKNILAPLRAAKDPRILDAWQVRMDLGDKTISAQKLTSGKIDFAQVQMPNWRFARAEDLLVLNRKDEAINEMYGLLKAYPSHPALEKWGQRLLQILKPDAPAS